LAAIDEGSKLRKRERRKEKNRGKELPLEAQSGTKGKGAL
jgi:hypothetical protein